MAGTGNGPTATPTRARSWKRRTLPRGCLRGTAPVLDPNDVAEAGDRPTAIPKRAQSWKRRIQPRGRLAQPATAGLQPVQVRSRYPPRVPCSTTRLSGRVTASGGSSGKSPRRPESESSRGRIGPGGRAIPRAVAQCEHRSKRRNLGPTEADVGTVGGADSIRFGGRPWEQGLNGDVDPGSPPGAEVMARGNGGLTQNREGLGGRPDHVVGQGRRYNHGPWEIRGCNRVWRIGPE